MNKDALVAAICPKCWRLEGEEVLLRGEVSVSVPVEFRLRSHGNPPDLVAETWLLGDGLEVMGTCAEEVNGNPIGASGASESVSVSSGAAECPECGHTCWLADLRDPSHPAYSRAVERAAGVAGGGMAGAAGEARFECHSCGRDASAVVGDVPLGWWVGSTSEFCPECREEVAEALGKDCPGPGGRGIWGGGVDARTRGAQYLSAMAELQDIAVRLLSGGGVSVVDAGIAGDLAGPMGRLLGADGLSWAIRRERERMAERKG